jgi:hypothetical protein
MPRHQHQSGPIQPRFESPTGRFWGHFAFWTITESENPRNGTTCESSHATVVLRTDSAFSHLGTITSLACCRARTEREPIAEGNSRYRLTIGKHHTCFGSSQSSATTCWLQHHDRRHRSQLVHSSSKQLLPSSYLLSRERVVPPGARAVQSLMRAKFLDRSAGYTVVCYEVIENSPKTCDSWVIHT